MPIIKNIIPVTNANNKADVNILLALFSEFLLLQIAYFIPPPIPYIRPSPFNKQKIGKAIFKAASPSAPSLTDTKYVSISV